MQRLIVKRRKMDRRDLGYACSYLYEFGKGTTVYLEGLPTNAKICAAHSDEWEPTLYVEVPWVCPHLELISNPYNKNIVTLRPREWDECHDSFVLDVREDKR